MHLQHRRSADLDLFRTDKFDAEAMVAELAAEGVPLASVKVSAATVHAEVEGVRTSLLFFPYAPLEPPVPSASGVPVAAIRDIAAMKIEAIAARGARRDFYDLYSICHAGLSLREALAAFQERFASAHPDLYHRVRALTFFEDAEREPEPLMLQPVDWATVKAFFGDEAKRIWRDGGGP